MVRYNLNSPLKNITLVFFLTLSGMININAQETYYIRNGNQISKVEHSDPTKVNAKEWQVLLFKRGASKTPGTQWGLISGKSAEEVMHKLKSNQDFEIRYNKWAGKGAVQDEVYTHFNPLGPVAVVEKSSPGKSSKQDNELKEKLNKVLTVYNNVKEYLDNQEKIAKILSESNTETPFDDVGNVFKEYTENLKQAFQRVSDLQNRLQRGMNISMEQIDININEINKNLQVVRTNSGILSAKTDNPKQNENTGQGNTSNNTENSSPHKTGADFEKLTEELISATGNIDPNNPKASYINLQKIISRLAKAISEDPEADQSMKKLGNLLSKMAKLDMEEDTEKFMQYLQEMTELVNEIK